MTRLIASMGVAAGMAWGQSAPAPAFEAASIKQHVFAGEGGGRLGMSISGSRVTVSIVTLNRLIGIAYDVKAYQISGGPSWAGDSTTAFDIDARAGSAPTTDQARGMLQGLLTDRFHLKVHREMKDLPVYDVLVAKGGLKMKQGAADAKPSAIVAGYPVRRLTEINEPIAVLIGQLPAFAGRPVIDKTGLAGSYDFTLEWMDEGAPADEAPGPSIFTAVEEQLGLKLESSKAPTEMLVIDHAEKPTDN